MCDRAEIYLNGEFHLRLDRYVSLFNTKNGLAKAAGSLLSKI